VYNFSTGCKKTPATRYRGEAAKRSKQHLLGVEENNGKCATAAVDGNFLPQNVQKCCKTIDRERSIF